jgi:multiple antibiotic resistance protein
MTLDQTLMELFLTAFVTFFVLIDAPGVAPLFASMTEQGGAAYRRRMAIRSVMVATFVLFGFAFGGSWLMDKLGITLDAFRAAGGALLFLIALDMVFEKRTERREKRAEQVMAEDPDGSHLDDISVFPIGIPMIAGPGSIATAMLFMTEAGDSWAEKGIVSAAIGLNLLITLVIFLGAGLIVKVLGQTIAHMITRILGVILSALAFQLMLDGIGGAFNLI